MRGILWPLLSTSALASSTVRQSSALSSGPSAVSSPVAGITNIPVYNATISGQPRDTTVDSVPDASQCNYSSGDLYCFPDENSFVQMTGWTRFFYNKNYGLINNSGLVDITMHFATDDEPAASWIGVQNTGNIPINVNISWFTSTLSPQATYSAADPYYFYVRPNSAVYNAYPTGSSRGPTFYAVQTPVQRLVVAATATAAPSSRTTPNAAAATTGLSSGNSGAGGATSGQSSATLASSNTDNSNALSRGAIAGIVIGAVALFFVLLLLGIVLLLLLRRQRYAEEAAAAAAANEEKRRRHQLAPGNLYTPAELAAAGDVRSPGTRRPSVDQTDSSGSVPMIIHSNPLARQTSPLARQASIARPARAQVQHYTPPSARASPTNAGPFADSQDQ